MLQYTVCTLCYLLYQITTAAAQEETFEPLPQLNSIYKLSDKIVNPYGFSFTLNVDECADDVELLVVVHSSPKQRYTSRRLLMRNTWLSPVYLQESLGFKIRVVFFMGTADNSTDQRRVEYEQQIYRDIVQSSFTDSYRHNTYKAMSFLLWTSRYCNQSKLLLKVDDDVLVRIKAMKKLAVNMKVWMNSKEPLYIGKALAEPYNPHREKEHPYYISKEEWPYKHFPLWLQGMIFFLSPRHTAELYEAALRTTYLFMDDVFIGICVNKTAWPAQETLNLENISTYRFGPSKKKKLQLDWNEAKITFFHVGDVKIFLNFFHQEFDQLSIQNHIYGTQSAQRVYSLV